MVAVRRPVAVRSPRWTANGRRRSPGAWVLAALALAASSGVVGMGCTRVAPYERGRLAHPTLRADLPTGAGRAHLYAIREGARGGRLGAGSGCGCN